MDTRIQWNSDGRLFQILLVGEPEEVKYYIEFLKKMGLKDDNLEKKNFLEGTLSLPESDGNVYPVEITIKSPTEFLAIPKSDLKFDGIMIYKKHANLNDAVTVEPYTWWKDWGNGQVKRLMFLDASIGVEEYDSVHREQGEIGISYRFYCFFREMQKVKKVGESGNILKERI